LLLQEVRTAIDNYGATINKPMLLTAAVGASQEHMNNVDWNAVAPLLDIINLMSYDSIGT
jgi:GH18 family chitinase